MRDTLRPDALPASPRGTPRGLIAAFRAIVGHRRPLLHSQPVRLVPSVRSACGFRGLAWMRAALRGICLFSLAVLGILAGCLLAL